MDNKAASQEQQLELAFWFGQINFLSFYPFQVSSVNRTLLPLLLPLPLLLLVGPSLSLGIVFVLTNIGLKNYLALSRS